MDFLSGGDEVCGSGARCCEGSDGFRTCIEDDQEKG
jgi:hypothetical protein